MGNIILLTITILLLFQRIKNSKSMLTEENYFKYMSKKVNECQEKYKTLKLDENTLSTTRSALSIIILLFELFIMLYYIVLGTTINTPLFVILTVVQLLSCVYSLKEALSINYLSDDLTQYKYHPIYFKFNILLDITYYGLSIYYLTNMIVR